MRHYKKGYSVIGKIFWFLGLFLVVSGLIFYFSNACLESVLMVFIGFILAVIGSLEGEEKYFD